MIPDPYFGKNEDRCSGWPMREWEADAQLHAPEPSRDWYLDIDYLDTVASVRVNG